MTAIEDEELLLAVLNSAPTENGVRRDTLAGDDGGGLTERFGGWGSAPERAALQRTRDALQAVISGRTGAATAALTELLEPVSLVPQVGDAGLDWQLDAPEDLRLAARTILAWSRVMRELPGRLRACANDECTLYLIDHSRPGTARWCSMATCGNRMKARAYASRARGDS